MPAPNHVILSPEEDRTLAELRVARTVPQRTCDRAHMIRLNAQGWRVPAIAELFECHEHTVSDPTTMGTERVRWVVGSPWTGCET